MKPISLVTHGKIRRGKGGQARYLGDFGVHGGPSCKPALFKVSVSLNSRVLSLEPAKKNETCLRLGDHLTRLTEAWGFDQARELIPMARPKGAHPKN